eukprot:TRINITY_DN29313_c0_g1_i1.p2 TRINITY_DN29313_c0_g1~~TRINITY_DN29313_c0_g1_i1.p2  ORF type:complete len:179 (-),score=31.23 TRINITY_DN29313_c0_g1_i1:1137-1598(-)
MASMQNILISMPDGEELRALAIHWNSELTSHLDGFMVPDSLVRCVDSGEEKLNDEDSALVDCIILLVQAHPIRLAVSSLHGRRIGGVGIAPRKKQREQAAKAALRLLCQDASPYVGTLSTPLRAQASIEDSLARKPTRAEQDTDKPFAVLVDD